MKTTRQSQPSDLIRTLRDATTYTEWQDARVAYERITGIENQLAQRWGASSLVGRLQTDRRKLEDQRHHSDPMVLADRLTESLHSTLAELNDERLYGRSKLASHPAVGAYLDTVCDTLDFLCDSPIPGLSDTQKLAHFKSAQRNLGVPALLLSGGGTFGISHLGVIKTLIEEKALPDVISGTSMGSIVAGMLANHTDDELKAIFAAPHNQHYAPLVRLPWRDMLSQKSLLDIDALTECVRANLGEATFAEAYAKTGRTVSITVSPTRAGQKPRILNHLTAPDVLIAEASIASCAIPLLYPAVLLKARRGMASPHAYAADERWADGSFATDIPRQRLSRLCNVNFFVVSQANPHILPFATHRQQSGIVATLRDLAITTAHRQVTGLLDVAKRRINNKPLRRLLDHVDALLDQDYFGDITIHPRFSAAWYLKFMTNPNAAEFEQLILTGERATWPMLARLREQTRISRKLQSCIARMNAKAGNEASRVRLASASDSLLVG